MKSMPPWFAPLLLMALLWTGMAQAHEELLFAQISSSPPAPVANEPFELQVRLTESSGRPVTDVNLVASLRESVEESADETAAQGEISGGIRLRAAAAGNYTGRMDAVAEGVYQLSLVEVVGGRTEASGSVLVEIGSDNPLEGELLLPPSGGSGFGSWLVWLVGLPLLAGLLVTLLVFTGRGGNEEKH